MLAEDCPVDVEEDADCGCLVVTLTIDGMPVPAHHDIPDDFAPHVPDSECGCGPILHTRPGRLVYEHIDQDSEAR